MKGIEKRRKLRRLEAERDKLLEQKAKCIAKLKVVRVQISEIKKHSGR